MGIMKTILEFLGGKDPDIFDANGRVLHKFPEEKWKQWDDRFKGNSDYDWRKHGAQERVQKSPSESAKNESR